MWPDRTSAGAWDCIATITVSATAPPRLAAAARPAMRAPRMTRRRTLTEHPQDPEARNPLGIDTGLPLTSRPRAHARGSGSQRGGCSVQKFGIGQAVSRFEDPRL